MPESDHQLKAVKEAVTETYYGVTKVAAGGLAIVSAGLTLKAWWVWLNDKGDPFYWLLAAFGVAASLAAGIFVALVRARKTIHADRTNHSKELQELTVQSAEEKRKLEAQLAEKSGHYRLRKLVEKIRDEGKQLADEIRTMPATEFSALDAARKGKYIDWINTTDLFFDEKFGPDVKAEIIDVANLQMTDSFTNPQQAELRRAIYGRYLRIVELMEKVWKDGGDLSAEFVYLDGRDSTDSMWTPVYR